MIRLLPATLYIFLGILLLRKDAVQFISLPDRIIPNLSKVFNTLIVVFFVLAQELFVCTINIISVYWIWISLLSVRA
jgi:hypothetical protein